MNGVNPPFTIDNVVVTGKKLAVATTIDADTTFTQFAGQTVAYYSTSTTTQVVGRIIATVANPSQDMGCTTASVQSAGTGKTAFSTAGGSFSRANKVIKITPAVANATATYQATVYFSTAELSPTWTSTEIPTLKLLKVKDGVSLTGVINSADAQLVSPSFGDNSTAAGYYSYTGNFKGFSQFLLVSPNTVLAASLSNFTATAQTSSILLNWSTATGVNIQGFKIDKSTDGINFSPLGALVSSTSGAAYSYDDKQVVVNTDYYYRIRIINLDNTEDTSYIKQAKIIKTTLLSFDASALKNTILLNWATGLEVNNKGFYIDRSTNGVNFSNISWVAGKINSSTTSAYSYEDVMALANTDYYYRIRLVNSVTNAQDTSYIRQARISKTVLNTFTATAQTNSILLNWSTAIEVNNKGFYIDRSTNGIDFSNIGWMVGKINSATPSAYSYDDLLALANPNYYYRIRWVNNLDNSQDTSSIKQARITKVDLGKTNLANFTATGQTSSILLNWSTSIEVNSKGFYIDRSTNGIDFKQLTWVNGKGNSAGISTYSFADVSALTDTNYFYRIRLVNSLTNAEDTSFIREARITLSTALSVRLTPVPAKDVLNITIGGTSALSTVHLLNARGQLVKSWKNLSSGITYNYNITGLASGVYLLQVITPRENLTKKIIIGQ